MRRRRSRGGRGVGGRAHLHEHVDRPRPHQLAVDTHRGQCWSHEGAEGDVVDADDRHVVGDGAAEVLQLAHRPDGHHVVVGEDSVEPRQSVEQLGDAGRASLDGLVGPHHAAVDVVGEIGDGPAEAALARLVDRPAARAGHHAEDPPAPRSEVFDSEVGAAFGVRLDRPDERMVDGVVDGDDRHGAVSNLAELVLTATHGKDDEAVAAAIDERADDVLLAVVLAL